MKALPSVPWTSVRTSSPKAIRRLSSTLPIAPEANRRLTTAVSTSPSATASG